MRQEAKQRNDAVTVATVAGYHWSRFKAVRIFTSDRTIKLSSPSMCKMAGYGLEIETECFGMSTGSNQSIYATLLQNVCFTPLPDDLFRIENDASLAGGHCAQHRANAVSAECVTQIMTKSFIRNNYKNFRSMYEYFEAFGIDNTRSGNCGMHTNISNYCFGKTAKAQEDGARKLYYIINKHYALMCAMLRRDPSNTRWCARMRHEMDYVKRMDLNNMSDSHGNCCNWSHFNEGRVELRLTGAQKNFASFRNTMETIFHLVEASKTLSWDKLDDVTAIFAGCNQYVYDRLTLARREGATSDAIIEAVERTIKRVDW